MNKHIRTTAVAGQAGVTLIELMVVLVIVAILSAVALPSYTRHVANAQRAGAKAILMETAQYMERYYTTQGSYAGAAVTSAVAPKNASGAAVRYLIGFAATPDAAGFTVQAVPTGAQAGDPCGTLSLSSTGAQGAATSDCW